MDPLIKPHKNLHVYEMLVELVDVEEQSTNQIRASEEEVLTFLLFSWHMLCIIYLGEFEWKQNIFKNVWGRGYVMLLCFLV